MNLRECLLQLVGSMERYAAKKSKGASPELFGDEGQAKWVQIGGEPGADGHKHGGHPVKIGKDGKMLTGAFAGKTMDEAFGKKDHVVDANKKVEPSSDGLDHHRSVLKAGNARMDELNAVIGPLEEAKFNVEKELKDLVA